ncbi:hypothetical protein V496_04344 [Pseudogymnoascus sp. VKM F-4515 (FW-2607)]|nr:hypothetical protein V496_04344 [Pseudogymnoascus sp. VKM F-4515 (FW-2607)]
MRPPYSFVVEKEIPRIGYRIGVRLRATPDTGPKLAHLRQQLAQVTGTTAPDSEIFHVTLAYLLRNPTPKEVDDLNAFVDHLAKAPEIVELPTARYLNEQRATFVLALSTNTTIFHISKYLVVPPSISPIDAVQITMNPEVSEPPTTTPRSFPELHIIEPTSAHTHTAILLHGRGSNGPEFAEELMEESRLPGHPTLAQKFSSWRFVFPSSRQLWNTFFEEDMPAWFEAHSLTDITARQELQEPGIIEGVGYLSSVLGDEIERAARETPMTKSEYEEFPSQRALQFFLLLLADATITMLFLFFLLFATILAQRPSSISICDYYTQVEYGSASEENQFKLMQGIVALAFAGPKSIPSKNVPKELTGILNLGVEGGHRVDLMPFFNGTLASTNLNNQPVGINWLDDGGLTPLSDYLTGKTKSVVLSNSTNEYRLFGHFYTSFSRIFGCSLPPASPATPGGSLNLAYAHKFMSLEFAEVAYFINQLTLAAEFYGFSEADAQALNTRMNSLYNSRCAPPVTFSSRQGPQLLSLCQDPSCPLAVPNSDCEAYTNLTADGRGSSTPSGAESSETGSATSSPNSTTETPPNSAAASTNGSHKLSAGGIAGVTIGSIAAITLLTAAPFFYRKRHNASKLKPQTQRHWTGPESVDYHSPQSDKFTTFSPDTSFSPAELHSPKSPEPPIELSGETNGAENERISRAS